MGIHEEGIEKIWRAYEGDIIARWAADHPGTRPSLWWRFTAPRWRPEGQHRDCWYVHSEILSEPRLRLGGTGTPAHEVLAYAPSWPFGIPDTWITPEDVDLYSGRARDVRGQVIDLGIGGDFAGVAIDPADPPAYESQAAYLDRHELLLPKERARLRTSDFKPERVSVE